MEDSVSSLFQNWDWRPDRSKLSISTIDTHTGGEPLRIITGGLPPLNGTTVLEKRRYFMENFDHIRRGILQEPRGHADMYGAVLSEPSDDADLDVFFLNTVGYSPMCGHAILAIAKVALETGLVRKSGSDPTLVINVPPGRNYAKAQVIDGEVVNTSFRNVPSFVSLRDAVVDVPNIGPLRFDLAFGGAFYAIVEATDVGVSLDPAAFDTLVRLGRQIKAAVLNDFAVEHPFEDEMSTLFGVIFTGPPHDPSHHSRNVTVFEDGEVDRSATGTGVSARAALHVARGELGLHERIVVESILGSVMTVEAVEDTTFGPYEAIIPEVIGSAHIMAVSEFILDPGDPFKDGFQIR